MSKRLSLEVAKTLMAQYRVEQLCPNDWGLLDLRPYSQIDPPALQYFARQKIDGVVILGLRHVDVFSAQTMACAWKAHHVFSECTHLSPDVAAILASGIEGLVFEWLPELDIEAARALAKTRGQLGVGRLDELSLEMAEALAGHTHELFVSVATQPRMFVQRSLLFSHAGYVVHLSFPADEVPAADWYVDSVKKVTIDSYTDDTGQLWARIVAAEDIDSWRLRQ